MLLLFVPAEILAPSLKLELMATLFSNFYHFDQPLPGWQPLFNEYEEKDQEMGFSQFLR